jgi:hypothetical protein
MSIELFNGMGSPYCLSAGVAVCVPVIEDSCGNKQIENEIAQGSETLLS